MIRSINELTKHELFIITFLINPYGQPDTTNCHLYYQVQLVEFVFSWCTLLLQTMFFCLHNLRLRLRLRMNTSTQWRNQRLTLQWGASAVGSVGAWLWGTANMKRARETEREMSTERDKERRVGRRRRRR